MRWMRLIGFGAATMLNLAVTGANELMMIHNEHRLRVLLAQGDVLGSVNSSQASEFSQKVRTTMKTIRGGSLEFYADLFKALLITTCKLQIDQASSTIKSSQRYVDESDTLAYKDSTGSCVKIKNPEAEVKKQYDSGKCEVKPNCYWREINGTNRDRIPVYATDADSAMPRLEGDPSYEDASKTLQKWATGLVIFVAPGIILAVLSLLTMLLFVLCRCCCNRCGGRNPKPEGYSCTKKLLPIFFFLFFSAAIAACAGVALLYNRQFTNSVTDLFDITKKTLNDSSQWVNNIRTPLIAVKGVVKVAGTDISTTLNGTDFIETGLMALTTRLSDFGKDTAGVTLPRGCVYGAAYSICIQCEVCTGISTQITLASNQMNTAAASGVKTLKDTRSILKEQIASQSESIFNTIDTQVDSTHILTDTIDTAKTTVEDIRKTWDSQDVYRAYGVLALFSLAVVVIALGLVGVIFGLTPLKFIALLLHLAYMIGFFALFISFILASVLIAMSVLLSDVCEVTDIMKTDWAPVMGPDAAKGVNACFRNQSLLDAFNLTGSLDFANQLNFAGNLDLNAMLDFSQFDAFQSQIGSTTTATFNTSSSSMLETVLNTLTKSHPSTTCLTGDNSYTVLNSLAPWQANGEIAPAGNNATLYMLNRYTPFNSGCSVLGPFKCGASQTTCAFADFVGEAWKNLSTIRQIQLDADSFVTSMKTNMTSVTTFIGQFKTNTTTLNTKIKNVMGSLTDGLLKEIGNFKESMYCTFVSDNFGLIMVSMCADLIPALTMIALATFLMGLFLIAVNICLIILSKRLRASGNGHVIPKENEFK